MGSRAGLAWASKAYPRQDGDTRRVVHSMDSETLDFGGFMLLVVG